LTTDDRFDVLTSDVVDEPQAIRNEILDGPVVDYATDFDHTGAEWVTDPFPIMNDLRTRCPIAHTERFGGGWLPTRHDDVAAIAYDTERFSSRSVVMSNTRPHPDIAPVGVAPPISSDPPFHHGARRLLLPAFAPQAITRLEPGARAYCDELLDALEGRDVVDAAAEFAQHIPVRVIADMLGFPREDAELFRGFVHDVLEGVNDPLETRFPKMQALFEYLGAQITDHAHRHDLERHRRVDLAPRPHPCGPRARRGRPRPGAHGHGGAAAGVRAGHHGPPGQAGHGVERLPDEGRRLDPPVVPGRQP
jgi:cytochrome P450